MPIPSRQGSGLTAAHGITLTGTLVYHVQDQVTSNPSGPSTTSSATSLGPSLGAPSLADGEMCTTQSADRRGRRPFLQIVVLYASDSRVLKYAKDVQSTFLDNGVDVFLQTEWEGPTGVSLGDTSTKPGSIKELSVGKKKYIYIYRSNFPGSAQRSISWVRLVRQILVESHRI